MEADSWFGAPRPVSSVEEALELPPNSAMRLAFAPTSTGGEATTTTATEQPPVEGGAASLRPTSTFRSLSGDNIRVRLRFNSSLLHDEVLDDDEEENADDSSNASTVSGLQGESAARVETEAGEPTVSHHAPIAIASPVGFVGWSLSQLLDVLRTDDEGGEDDDEDTAIAQARCAVCRVRTADCLIVPCRHLAYCLRCAVQAQRRQPREASEHDGSGCCVACPVCRHSVHKLVRVYLC